MGRRKAIFGVLAILILIVLSLSLGVVVKRGELFSPRGTLVETAIARVGRFTSTVSCSGTVEPSDPHEVRSPVAGRIAKVYVRDGERVKPGQLLISFDAAQLLLRKNESRAALAQAQADLAELDSSSLDGGEDPKVIQAQARLDAARARLRELEAGPDEAQVAQAKANLEEADAALREARDNLAKMQMLFEAGATAKKNLDDAKMKEETAKYRLDAAKKQYDKAAGGPSEAELTATRSDVKDAEIGLRLAKEAVDSRGRRRQALLERIKQLTEALTNAEAQLRAKDLRSPSQGVVAGSSVKAGTFATEGMLLMTIFEPGHLEIRARVDEMDVGKIKAGQKAKIVCDALPDREFAGVVKAVSPWAVMEGNVPKFVVTVSVDNSEGLLRPGMTADMDIVVYDRADVVSVPSQAVVEGKAEGEGKAVFVVVDGKAVWTPVKTGMENATEIEVTEGIKPGDEIVTGNYEVLKTLKGGDSVRTEASTKKGGRSAKGLTFRIEREGGGH